MANYYITQSITLVSQETSTNTSIVSVKVVAKASSGYSVYNHSNTTLVITVDGTKYTKTISDLSLSSGGSQTLGTWQFTVNHNADGSKVFQVSSSYNTGVSSVGTLKTSGSKTLTPIPRYAIVTLSSYMITDGETLSVSLEDYTDSIALSYTCNNHTVNVGTYTSGSIVDITYSSIVSACSLTDYSLYTITITATNTIGDATESVSISTGAMPFSAYDDGLGNIGFSIGKRCTEAGSFEVHGVVPKIPMNNLIRIHNVTINTSVSKSTSKNCSGSYTIDSGWLPIAVVNRKSTAGTNRPNLVYYSEYLEVSNNVCTVTLSVRNNNTTSTASSTDVIGVLEIYVGG